MIRKVHDDDIDRFTVAFANIRTVVYESSSASPGTLGAWRWSPVMAKQILTQHITCIILLEQFRSSSIRKTHGKKISHPIAMRLASHNGEFAQHVSNAPCAANASRHHVFASLELYI